MPASAAEEAHFHPVEAVVAEEDQKAHQSSASAEAAERQNQALGAEEVVHLMAQHRTSLASTVWHQMVFRGRV